MISRTCHLITCQKIFEVRIPSDPKKFCSKSCATIHNRTGFKHRPETRSKISTFAKANPRGATAHLLRHAFKPGNQVKRGKYKRLPIQAICQECGKNFSYMQYGQTRKYCSVKCSNLNKYHPNRTRVHRSIYQGYQMDSGAELALAKILNQERIAWIKNDNKWKKWFPYEYNGKKGKYYPDFYLPDFDIWIEVKGRRYIRDGDDERRMSVKRPVLLFIANEFKTKMPLYLDQIRSFQQ